MPITRCMVIVMVTVVAGGSVGCSEGEQSDGEAGSPTGTPSQATPTESPLPAKTGPTAEQRFAEWVAARAPLDASTWQAVALPGEPGRLSTDGRTLLVHRPTNGGGSQQHLVTYKLPNLSDHGDWYTAEWAMANPALDLLVTRTSDPDGARTTVELVSRARTVQYAWADLSGWITQVAWHADKPWLAVGSSTGQKIYLLDTQDGDLIHEWTFDFARSDTLEQLAFVGDCLLARNSRGVLLIIDAKKGERVGEHSGVSMMVARLDERSAVLVSDKSIGVLDVPANQLIAERQTGIVMTIGISPDGQYLAVPQYRRVRILSLPDLEPVYDRAPGVGGLFGAAGLVSFVPGQAALASAGKYGKLILLDLRTSQVAEIGRTTQDNRPASEMLRYDSGRSIQATRVDGQPWIIGLDACFMPKPSE